MNRMSRGILHLRERLSASVSAPLDMSERMYITIRSGNTYEIDIGKAWTGRTAFRVEDSENSRVVWSDRDYLIPYNLLVIDGILIDPKRGDRILEAFTDPTVTQTFEVSAPENEQVYRYSDMGNTILRIHTKRVA